METMSEKVGAMGGNMGSTFDDGVFDGVKKIIVGKDFNSVTYIKIEYEKDGIFETREHGTIRGELQEFTVDYPNEYITAVGGSYEHVFSYGTVLIKSLIFKTSYGRTSPILGLTTLFGNPSGREFMLEGKNGGKLLGFHGRSGQALDAIGPHFFAVNSPLKQFKPQGGNGGNAWDDGAFDGVRKVLVGGNGKFVSYVRFEYAKGERMVPHDHGKREGVPQEFVVDYPNEHITLVEGTIDGYISSLKFKTSKGRTSPAFGNVVGRKFVLEEKGFKLVGFCGRSGDAIDAIGAQFAPLPSPVPTPAPAPAPVPTPAPAKTELVGGKSGNTFDDGRFDGVKKITVGADEYSIAYIKIEYVKDGKVVTREHGTIRGEVKEFSVDYPKENITAVGGSYDHIYTYDTTLITSLYFTTSNGFTSPLFGKTGGKDFNLKGENGEILVGFHGRGGTAIDAIGAYFDTSSKGGEGGNSGSGDSKSVDPETQPGDKPVGPGPNPSEDSNSGSGPSSDSSTQKLDAQGGKGGNQWDDGGDHDGVTKIHLVGSGRRGIDQIKFDYLKSGQPKEGTPHGVEGSRSFESTIEIHPDEYLVSVKGWYNSSNVIQGLQFQTSTKTSDYFVSEFSGDGTEFSLTVKDKKIVGFHGFADSGLNSLGAYFAPITSTPLKPGKKLKAVGGDEGDLWDDGVFDGIRKIHVGQSNDGVSFVEIEYKKGSQIVLGNGHGKKSALGVETFELTDPGEYIKAVGVYYDKVYVGNRGVVLVTSLVFITNEQTSPPFGMTGGEYFELKEEGQKIVGFHGKASDWVHQIGVYVAPITN